MNDPRSREMEQELWVLRSAELLSAVDYNRLIVELHSAEHSLIEEEVAKLMPAGWTMSEVIATIKQFEAVFPDRGGAIFKSFAWHFRRDQEFPLAAMVDFKHVDGTETDILPETMARLNGLSRHDFEPPQVARSIYFGDVIIVDPEKKPYDFQTKILPLDRYNFWKHYLDAEQSELVHCLFKFFYRKMILPLDHSREALRQRARAWLPGYSVEDAIYSWSMLLVVKFWAAVFHRKDVDPQIEFLEYLWTHGNYPVGFCWNKERRYRELVVFASEKK
jgi:hypothetical protein